MNLKKLIQFQKTLTLSTWYRSDEKFMKDYDYLSRNNCFMVRAKRNKLAKKYHFITTMHTVYPFYYPKLYQKEWIKDIQEKDIKNILEIRNENGDIIFQIPFSSQTHKHPTLDIIILHLEEKQENLLYFHNFFDKSDINLVDSNIEDLYFNELDISGFRDLPDIKSMGYKNIKTLPNVIKDNKIYSSNDYNIDDG
jgi:hypothetical protein